MRRFLVLHLIFFSFYLSADGKKLNKKSYPWILTEKKELQAVKTNERLKIDGILNELSWENLPVAKDFVTFEPTIGKPASQKSEVKVLYDNNAIYIGALLYDARPDSILKELSKRDDLRVNSDIFWITLNPYNDGQNIFKFIISSSNVQTDIKISSGKEDIAWNAVWESNVKIIDKGWSIEVKIPYSAIRFPKEEIQSWSINFWRQIRRIREVSSWNLVNRTYDDTGSQDGALSNIKEIQPPFRLSLYPYISAAANYTPDENKRGFTSGMDLKYGINESFTIDMTLIPDFGQRPSDDEILNLSAYEVQYSENRQFFTEGTELFNKAGLFYSRRVGGKPSGYDDIEDNLKPGENIIENPEEANLVNATKISGRTKKRMGLGLFNAITANTYAIIQDSTGNKTRYLTEPLSNFNILVADQTFWSNSYINLINTNVYSPSTNRMANVSGTAFKLSDKKNSFGIEGISALSIINDTSMVTGYMGQYKIGKLSGTLQYNYELNLLTDTYDPNDMGFVSRNNELTNYIQVKYQVFEPVGIFLKNNANLTFQYSRLYAPGKFASFVTYFNINSTLQNYLSLGINSRFSPVNYNDYYEPRVDGRAFKTPPFYVIDFWFSSDYRKTLAIDGGIGIRKSHQKGYFFRVSPILRVSDKLNFIHNLSYEINYHQKGYVENLSPDTIIFGNRDNNTIINTFSGSYIFNNKSSLSLRLRHYWSTVDYNEFYNLKKDGFLENIDYYKNEDVNFNKFNIDLMYSWNFAPGSFMNIVWKNSIINEQEIIETNFYDNLKKTLKNPQNNLFSIKISYYIDCKNIAKRKT